MSSLKEEFLELLERDREFRYAVAGFLGLDEILKRLDMHEQRLVELREEAVKLREDMITGFKRYDEEIRKLREDMVAGFKRHDEEIVKLREDMNRGFALVERHISALVQDGGYCLRKRLEKG